MPITRQTLGDKTRLPAYQSESAFLTGGAPSGFPYRFISVADTGQVAVSDTGAAWAANGAIVFAGISSWTAAAINETTKRVLVVGSSGTANRISVASTLTGDTWPVVQDSVAAGVPANSGVCKLLWTNLFNAGRFYCQVRRNGATNGGVWYSDDDGLTWAAMPFAGAPTPIDVEWLAIGPDRVLCGGAFAGDAAGTKRLFYSTDGANMLAGATGVTAVGASFGAISDGYARSAVYLTAAGIYLLIGASTSDFFRPFATTTPDGVTATVPFTTGANVNADSGSGVYMSNVGQAFIPWVDQGGGAGPFTAFSRTANGTVITNTNVGSPPYGYGISASYSASLGRAVIGQRSGAGQGGFAYTDDAGATSNQVAGPAVRNWRATLATR